MGDVTALAAAELLTRVERGRKSANYSECKEILTAWTDAISRRCTINTLNQLGRGAAEDIVEGVVVALRKVLEELCNRDSAADLPVWVNSVEALSSFLIDSFFLGGGGLESWVAPALQWIAFAVANLQASHPALPALNMCLSLLYRAKKGQTIEDQSAKVMDGAESAAASPKAGEARPHPHATEQQDHTNPAMAMDQAEESEDFMNVDDDRSPCESITGSGSGEIQSTGSDPDHSTRCQTQATTKEPVTVPQEQGSKGGDNCIQNIVRYLSKLKSQKNVLGMVRTFRLCLKELIQALSKQRMNAVYAADVNNAACLFLLGVLAFFDPPKLGKIMDASLAEWASKEAKNTCTGIPISRARPLSPGLHEFLALGREFAEAATAICCKIREHPAFKSLSVAPRVARAAVLLVWGSGIRLAAPRIVMSWSLCAIKCVSFAGRMDLDIAAVYKAGLHCRWGSELIHSLDIARLVEWEDSAMAKLDSNAFIGLPDAWRQLAGARVAKREAKRQATEDAPSELIAPTWEFRAACNVPRSLPLNIALRDTFFSLAGVPHETFLVDDCRITSAPAGAVETAAKPQLPHAPVPQAPPQLQTASPSVHFAAARQAARAMGLPPELAQEFARLVFSDRDLRVESLAV